MVKIDPSFSPRAARFKDLCIISSHHPPPRNLPEKTEDPAEGPSCCLFDPLSSSTNIIVTPEDKQKK